jgi:hypothetical protein
MDKLKHEVLSRALNKMLFELNFPGIELDELEKEDLIAIANELKNRIDLMRDPKNHVTSKKLVDSYIKSVPKFPKLQAKLMKYLADQQPKDKKEIISKIYGRKNDRPDDALRQLVVSTNETIKNSGSSDIFHIEGKAGKLILNISLTNLSIILKSRTRKITK